jgi:hypothetical protein
MTTAASATVGGVLIGLVAGFPAGIIFVALRKAWADVGTAKKAVPKARRGAWGRTREAAILTFLLMLGVVLGIGAIRHR